MYRLVVKSVAVSLSLAGCAAVYAAEPVNLAKQPVSFLQSYIAAPANLRTRAAALQTDEVKEARRATDANHTTHIRVQQYHSGYPVWGADAVVHVPAQQRAMTRSLAAVPAANASTMNGTIYQNLNADLATTPAQIFNQAQADRASQKAVELAKTKFGAANAEVQKNQLMVYIDKKTKKAHWAFLVSVYLESAGENQTPAKPTYILDAVTFDQYKAWNDIKTLSESYSSGGGYGGNQKTGKLVYDGLQKNLAALSIVREGDTCYMKNGDVQIFDSRKGNSRRPFLMNFKCQKQDSQHNQVFWNGSMDSVNGGFSPANDALYAGTVVQSLYKSWYKVPMLINKDGSPMMLRMFTHYGKQYENAEWDDARSEIHLGDGKDWAYPLTSLGVIAHEVSHGFTSQHSDLAYMDESGSMNESFSDMAAQAAEVFATGTSTWQIGSEILKGDRALRYLDKPSKDCRRNSTPGSGCSIDSADQYDHLVKYGSEDLNLFGDDLQSYIVHLASGVYNHAFYILATSQGWDVKKAFQVMLNANSFYWASTTDFREGACGVMKSAADLHYDTSAVAEAFKQVGIETKTC